MPKPTSFHVIPGVAAWLSAIALYAFSRSFIYGVAVIIGPLLDLLEGHPRLAALASLGLWLSPIAIIAIGHALMSGVLDRFDSANGERSSGWVGLYSWLVALFATVTMLFVAAFLDPGQPDSDLFHHVVARMSMSGSSVAIHSVVWVVIAALLYRVEQRAFSSASSGASAR